jgi:hypothetical protein
MLKELFRFLAEAVGWASWERKRSAAKKDDPENKQAAVERKIDADVLQGNEAAVNERVDDALARLRMRRSRTDGMRERAEGEGDSGGSGD